MMFRSSATLALLLATASSFHIQSGPRGAVKSSVGARERVVRTISFSYLDGLAGESKGPAPKGSKSSKGAFGAKKEKSEGPKFKPVEDVNTNFLDGLKKDTMAGPTASSFFEGLKSTPEVVQETKSSVVSFEATPAIMKPAPAPVPVSSPAPVTFSSPSTGFSLGGPVEIPTPMMSQKPAVKTAKKTFKTSKSSMSYLDNLKETDLAPQPAFFAATATAPTATPVAKVAPPMPAAPPVPVAPPATFVSRSAPVAPPAPVVVPTPVVVAKVTAPMPVIKPKPVPNPGVLPEVRVPPGSELANSEKSGSSWLTNIALLGLGTVIGLLWENHLDLLDDDLIPSDILPNPFDSL